MFGVKNLMNEKRIKFIPCTELTEIQDPPSPASSNIPEWFKDSAPHIYKNSGYHDIIKINKDMLKNGGNWNSTFKHCLPFVDALTSGYFITTPADILVVNNNGIPYLKWNTDDTIIDSQDIDVLAGKFPVPEDCYNIVFRWTSEWKVSLDVGYSALFSHPLNRYDLPFYTLSGIVDADKHPNSVFIPFFLKKSFEGIIPAGTPIAQVIPFKRESWRSSIEPYDKSSRFSKYRVKKYIRHTYRKLYWSKKSYK
jgi:hypothetical protein